MPWGPFLTPETRCLKIIRSSSSLKSETLTAVGWAGFPEVSRDEAGAGSRPSLAKGTSITRDL